MSRIKLNYADLDMITDDLFKMIRQEYIPDTIIHPGIRTDYLIKKAHSFFNLEPFVIDTSRPLPCKKIMRKLLYDLFDYVPDCVADKIIDLYISFAHSNNRRPIVSKIYMNQLAPALGNVLILDDVFCTGNTAESISTALSQFTVRDIRTSALIFTPYNGVQPDYYGLKGRYSLPWRNVGI